jgi:hypothetical protein
MGLLRSCYSTKARFFYDSPVVNNIIWYWARTGAAWFPAGHVFAPLIFQGPTTLQINGVGEQPQYPRPWRNGSIPVASPTGIIDGEVRWFQQGQSVKDPGLARTPFGIPLNCTAAPFVPCIAGALQHYTWGLEMPLLRQIGTSSMDGVNQAQFTLTIPRFFDAFLICGVPPVGPAYDGLYLLVLSAFGIGAYSFPPVQVGGDPLYQFSTWYGSFDPGPLYVRWLPGP